MKPPIPGWLPTTTKVPVYIPTPDGASILETIEIEVPAWKDVKGGIYLDDRARSEMESVKARRLGIVTPSQLRALRQRLSVSQKEISELLRLGAKTWTRWETGKERPSQSLNILLRALCDGRLDVHYLRCLQASPSAKIAQFHFEDQSSLTEFRTWTENTTVFSDESKNIAA